MNQGRIWCVVNPTVGLPLFLGSVAVTSLIVHYSVLSNTSWFGNYWQGAKAKTASIEGAGQPVAINGAEAAQGVVISVAPSAQSANGTASYVITVAPKVAAVAQAGEAPLPDKVAMATLSR